MTIGEGKEKKKESSDRQWVCVCGREEKKRAGGWDRGTGTVAGKSSFLEDRQTQPGETLV